MQFKKTIITIILSVSFLFTIAQNTSLRRSNKYELDTKFHGGLLLATQFEMKPFESFFPAFELSVQKKTNGAKRWEAIYRYPIIGVTYFYSPLGGFKEIGSAHSIYPFISFPLIQNSKNEVYFKFGVGLAYLTNKFDPIENYRNILIGSHLNAIIALQIGYHHKLSNRLKITASAGISHFSYYSNFTENLGLNVGSISAGLIYKLAKSRRYLDATFLPELYKFEFDGRKFISLEGQISFGVKETTFEEKNTHLVLNWAMNVLKQINNRGKIGLGFDITRDGSDRIILDRRYGLKTTTPESNKSSINIAYEMLFDNTSLMFNLGAYLSGAARSEGDLYQKIALKHLFTKNLYGIMTLKMHFVKADNFSMGIGYRIDFKYY